MGMEILQIWKTRTSVSRPLVTLTTLTAGPSSNIDRGLLVLDDGMARSSPREFVRLWIPCVSLSLLPKYRHTVFSLIPLQASCDRARQHLTFRDRLGQNDQRFFQRQRCSYLSRCSEPIEDI